MVIEKFYRCSECRSEIQPDEYGMMYLGNCSICYKDICDFCEVECKNCHKEVCNEHSIEGICLNCLDDINMKLNQSPRVNGFPSQRSSDFKQ